MKVSKKILRFHKVIQAQKKLVDNQINLTDQEKQEIKQSFDEKLQEREEKYYKNYFKEE